MVTTATLTRAKAKRKAAPASARAGARQRLIDVTVVLLESGFASTSVGPIEVFNAAGTLWNWLKGEPEQPRFRVRTASLDGKAVPSQCGLGLVPEHAIDDIERTDIVIVPASGWDVQERIARHSRLVPWLKLMHARGACIAGVCSGVAFLAEAGLLDGREATTHWGVAEILRERYPDVQWKPEQFVTEDRMLFCSGGVYSSIDLSLHMVEKFCGHEIALQCAKSLLVSLPRSRQSGYSAASLARAHTDERIRESEAYLRLHFHRPVPIEQLAKRAAMSPRNFIRRFKAATGRLPGGYVQLLRVAAAKQLLETSALPVQQVCARSGYGDIASFRNVFKRHTGMTPVEYRERFGHAALPRPELVTG